MSKRLFFKALAGFLCFIAFFVVLTALLKDDSPAYEWIPFEATEEEADGIVLVSDSDSVSAGIHEIRLTITNNTSYTIVVPFLGSKIQKLENGSWYSIRSTQIQSPHDSNSIGYIGTTVHPAEIVTYSCSLTDLIPFPLQSPGEYRIYCPLAFLLDEEDDSKRVAAYVSAPMIITDK